MATNYTLTPSPWQTFFYATGAPVANGQLFTYLAGTTTPAVTYLNSSGTPNTNPIILDAAGRCVIYLSPGSYRFDLYDAVANGGGLIKTEDNISAVPVSASQPADSGIAGVNVLAGQCVYLSDGSGGLTPGKWYPAQANNAYSSTSPEIGFVLADTPAGGTIAIVRNGQQITGLVVTTGLAYFIDPLSAGSITTTPPPSARYVGQADSPSSLVIGNAPPAQPMTLISSVTGTVNDFAPGLSNFSTLTILRMQNTSLTTITGITAGYNGQRLIIEALGTARVDLANNSSGSSIQNRLANFASSASTSLAPGIGRAEYVYDSSTASWRIVSHNQGDWITLPFNAANFTGSGAMIWTVGVANVPVLQYYLQAKMLSINVIITSTGLSGTPAQGLQISNAAFGGFIAANAVLNAVAVAQDNGVVVAAAIDFGSASTTKITFTKPVGLNWTVSAAGTTVQAQITAAVS